MDLLKVNKPAKSIYEMLNDEIMAMEIPEEEKSKMLSSLIKAGSQKINLMIVGVSGSGKSSTINSLFNMNVAEVGVGVDPETASIEKYELNNLTIWDTPGLGDNVEKDKETAQLIIEKLSEVDGDDNMLIDLVLVVLDASSKDLSTSYDFINKTLIPCLGEDNVNRILIGINQSDMAMKGRHWNSEQNAPDETLEEFLNQKAESVCRRIFEATNVDIKPIYYCAGYTEDDGTQQAPYNLSKLLYYILASIPTEKRFAVVNNINNDEQAWLSNDDDMEYNNEIKQGFFESLFGDVEGYTTKFALAGTAIIGLPGMIVGIIIGGIADLFAKLVKRD